MKLAALADMVTAALFALAAFEFHRVSVTLDQLQARVQQHDIQLARLEVTANR